MNTTYLSFTLFKLQLDSFMIMPRDKMFHSVKKLYLKLDLNLSKAWKNTLMGLKSMNLFWKAKRKKNLRQSLKCLQMCPWFLNYQQRRSQNLSNWFLSKNYQTLSLWKFFKKSKLKWKILKKRRNNKIVKRIQTLVELHKNCNLKRQRNFLKWS